MELSSFKIKKNLIFLEIELSSLKFFLYLRKEPSELEKLKKDPSSKNLLYFRKWNFLGQSLKALYIFLKK